MAITYKLIETISRPAVVCTCCQQNCDRFFEFFIVEKGEKQVPKVSVKNHS